MAVAHFQKVDRSRVEAKFFSCGLHRATLQIPFLEREIGRTLCIVGQNPSAANEQHADMTVRFLERYVFEKLPEYSQMIMLNLYSRVDTKKVETNDVNHPVCEAILRATIATHKDFLFVFGKLKNQRAYKFPERVRELQPLFAGKNICKFDLKVEYAPHPGNQSIHYHNTNIELAPYVFP